MGIKAHNSLNEAHGDLLISYIISNKIYPKGPINTNQIYESTC